MIRNIKSDEMPIPVVDAVTIEINNAIVDMISRDPDIWNHAVMKACVSDSDYDRLSIDADGTLLDAVVESLIGENITEDSVSAAITECAASN